MCQGRGGYGQQMRPMGGDYFTDRQQTPSYGGAVGSTMPAQVTGGEFSMGDPASDLQSMQGLQTAMRGALKPMSPEESQGYNPQSQMTALQALYAPGGANYDPQAAAYAGSQGQKYVGGKMMSTQPGMFNQQQLDQQAARARAMSPQQRQQTPGAWTPWNQIPVGANYGGMKRVSMEDFMRATPRPWNPWTDPNYKNSIPRR